jgi:acetylornithine deacetylase
VNPTNKYINLLVQMLAIPSLSREEDTRALFLYNWLKQEGFFVQRNHNNLIITAGNKPEEATILMNSHLDTVSPGEGWYSDPYLPQVIDGKITALGSNDAGASVVSMIAAYQALIEEGKANNIVLIISAEEEVSGKNGISLELPKLKSIKFALVGEPTNLKAAVAERGLMVIDAFASGLQGHAARDEGVNAIYKAMKDIEMIRTLDFSDHSIWLKDPSLNVTMINAGTGHNVVPGKCEFVIDVRSNDNYSNEKLLELLSNTCTSELSARSLRLKSSFLKDDHPVSKLIADLGLDPFGSPTLSDMALMNFPSVKIGPGDSSRSHTANEYIYEEEIIQAISLYTHLIKQLISLEL